MARSFFIHSSKSGIKPPLSQRASPAKDETPRTRALYISVCSFCNNMIAADDDDVDDNNNMKQVHALCSISIQRMRSVYLYNAHTHATRTWSTSCVRYTYAHDRTLTHTLACTHFLPKQTASQQVWRMLTQTHTHTSTLVVSTCTRLYTNKYNECKRAHARAAHVLILIMLTYDVGKLASRDGKVVSKMKYSLIENRSSGANEDKKLRSQRLQVVEVNKWMLNAIWLE